MNRRELLKVLGLASAGLVLDPFNSLNKIHAKGIEKKLKHWAWLSIDTDFTIDEWKKKFERIRAAGIDAIIPEVTSSRVALYGSKHLPVKDKLLEKILPLAKDSGLEVHTWMWTMVCNNEEILKNHPEWYIVNARGESCLQHPPYAAWYKFLCPSREGPQDYITKTVDELASYELVDGVHLDYIRYPEVIISESLRPKYGIIQDKEYPEYDYCYCEVCRAKFKEQTGITLSDLKDPSINMEWKQFRYDSITNLVNGKLIPAAKKYNKQVTAAVFPPWNQHNVRQQWSNWNLDSVHLMNYNSFYWQGHEWIKNQNEIGIESLKKPMELYSGLFIPDLFPNGLKKAVEASLTGGANGIALFSAHSMTEEHWKAFEDTIRNYK
ncbi:MAG: family 10 glycosylhydrolase [Ignavibacteriaceae bacterium]